MKASNRAPKINKTKKVNTIELSLHFLKVLFLKENASKYPSKLGILKHYNYSVTTAGFEPATLRAEI